VNLLGESKLNLIDQVSICECFILNEIHIDLIEAVPGLSIPDTVNNKSKLNVSKTVAFLRCHLTLVEKHHPIDKHLFNIFSLPFQKMPFSDKQSFNNIQ
jgi:hypothetical protein